MQALLKVFWDIALWRRGPRDVPPSWGLLAIAALCYGATSVAFSALLGGPELALERGAFDLAFTAGTFWLCLAIARRSHRLQQTLTAVLGTGTLVALPMIAIVLLAGALGTTGPLANSVQVPLLLSLQVWAVCVVAHIARVALDAPLIVGIAVSTTYFLVGYLLIQRLLPFTVG